LCAVHVHKQGRLPLLAAAAAAAVPRSSHEDIGQAPKVLGQAVGVTPINTSDGGQGRCETAHVVCMQHTRQAKQHKHDI
jgi:hypothetical protein